MKIKIFTLFALMTGLFFTACSQNEEGGSPKGTTTDKSIYLKINTQDNGTRADVPTAVGTSATLYTALIYFLDGETNPVIHNVITVGPNGADITVAELQEGYKAEGISSAVTRVYIVGNYNSSDSQGNYANFPMQDGQTFSDIQSVLLNIEQVSHGSLDGGITVSGLVAVMDGGANIVQYSSNPGGWGGTGSETPAADDYYAVVTISPLVARIEIDEITYTGTYSSFTLEGIYINNYYQNLPMSLVTTGYTPLNNGSDVNKYQVGNATFAYTNYMTLYDQIGTAVSPAGTASFEPDNGTWAYQVFGNSNPVPHIILKLTDVISSTARPLGTRYVTIAGFQNGGVPVETFARNTIYRIANLQFSDDDTSVLPEPETISIWVRVVVEPWDLVNVTPVINN